MNRTDFMAQVRKSLGRSTPADAAADPPPPPDVDESLMRLAAADADLVATFVAKARAVGLHVHQTTEPELAAALAGIVESLGARRATVGLAYADDAQRVHATLARVECELVETRDEPGIGAHYDVDVGITDVQAAIAETGTLVIASDATHSRGTFIAPPVHVAIVRITDLVADLIDYWHAHPRPGESGACTVLVTGPSKTADIEGILVTGVHGPGAVHVLLVE